MDIITIVILIALTISSISSYRVWKKFRNKLAVQNFLVFMAAIAILLWPYFTKNVLHLHGQVAEINYYILQVFRVVAVGFLAWIMIKDFMPDNKK